MMITVYGRATSSNVQIVMWAAGELGLTVERMDYGHSYGGLDTDEFGQLNPNRRIPVLRDRDLVVWESAAILRYLAAQYGDDFFWPADPVERARLDMWAEWTKTTFGPAFNDAVFWPKVRVAPSQRDEGALAKAIEALKPVARILDARLGKNPYIGGEKPCFADIMTGHLLYRYYTLEFSRADTPSLDAYYDRLTRRPAYESHVMVSYEPLRARDT